MKQIQKLKSGDFWVVMLGIVFFVSGIVLWGQEIFWTRKNKTIEKSIAIKEVVIEELKVKNNAPKTENVREVLDRANANRTELAPIISDIWKLETQTVKFKNFSMNDNRITVAASSISAETIAKFIEMLKRTPGIANPLVLDFVANSDGADFNFVFDRTNK